MYYLLAHLFFLPTKIHTSQRPFYHKHPINKQPSYPTTLPNTKRPSIQVILSL